MEFGICEYAYLPLRAGMSHRSEMVSQVLFGEVFEIVARHSDWTKIRLLHDNYTGWIESVTISAFVCENHEASYVDEHYVVRDVPTMMIKNEKNQMFIPKGSLLPKSVLESHSFNIGDNNYYVLSDLTERTETDIRSSIIREAEDLIETPYLWGGRSQWGIDCSGFVQLVYRLSGLLMPRDASEQAKLGNTMSFISEAKPGDLAFFDNEEGNIVHVGIVYSPNEIIHASKKVRIDRIDHNGIYNDELKKYTHQLRVMKNVIGG